MHRGLAQVRVNEDNLLLECGGRLREVGGGEGLAGPRVGADNRDRAGFPGAFQHHEVRPQYPVGLDDFDALAARNLGDDRKPRERGDVGAVFGPGEPVADEVREHGELAHRDERNEEAEDRVAGGLRCNRIRVGECGGEDRQRGNRRPQGFRFGGRELIQPRLKVSALDRREVWTSKLLLDLGTVGADRIGEDRDPGVADALHGGLQGLADEPGDELGLACVGCGRGHVDGAQIAGGRGRHPTLHFGDRDVQLAGA